MAFIQNAGRSNRDVKPVARRSGFIQSVRKMEQACFKEMNRLVRTRMLGGVGGPGVSRLLSRSHCYPSIARLPRESSRQPFRPSFTSRTSRSASFANSSTYGRWGGWHYKVSKRAPPFVNYKIQVHLCIRQCCRSAGNELQIFHLASFKLYIESWNGNNVCCGIKFDVWPFVNVALDNPKDKAKCYNTTNWAHGNWNPFVWTVNEEPRNNDKSRQEQASKHNDKSQRRRTGPETHDIVLMTHFSKVATLSIGRHVSIAVIWSELSH